MQPSDLNCPTRRSRRLDPTIAATYCGLLSAVAYTAANICLRSVADCDPVWVSCVKAVPTVVLVGPWLVVRAARNQGIAPTWKCLGILALAGLLGQLGGNVLFQWALRAVGIAMTVPLCLGSMILAGVVVGRWFLGEMVTRRTLVATLILVFAISILSVGASAANRSFLPAMPANTQLLWVALGVAAACCSGVTYCVLGTVIRWTSNRGMPVSTILTVICSVGMLSLGILSGFRIGPSAMAHTAPRDLLVMLLAGVCNAGAFLALTSALQLAGLVYVNALNASQTAMAAIAGVILFGEPATPWLALGVLLTVGGLLLMQRRRPKTPTAAPCPCGSIPDEPVPGIDVPPIATPPHAVAVAAGKCRSA